MGEIYAIQSMQKKSFRISAIVIILLALGGMVSCSSKDTESFGYLNLDLGGSFTALAVYSCVKAYGKENPTQEEMDACALWTATAYILNQD